MHWKHVRWMIDERGTELLAIHAVWRQYWSSCYWYFEVHLWWLYTMLRPGSAWQDCESVPRQRLSWADSYSHLLTFYYLPILLSFFSLFLSPLLACCLFTFLFLFRPFLVSFRPSLPHSVFRILPIAGRCCRDSATRSCSNILFVYLARGTHLFVCNFFVSVHSLYITISHAEIAFNQLFNKRMGVCRPLYMHVCTLCLSEILDF